MELMEGLSTRPAQVSNLVPSAASSPAVLSALLALNWASLCTLHPESFADLLELTNGVLAANSPLWLKKLLETLLRSIFE
jgi:hypothetical protein